MDVTAEAVARVVARRRNRAVVTSGVAGILPDDIYAVGIAAIKIVTEEAVQALAYGPISSPPSVIARIHPMSRDARDLEPFAHWLITTLESAVARKSLARFWIPHAETLKLLAVLGHRYHSNTQATAELRRMGTFCLLLAEESRYPGQQVVVDAAALLRSHVVTGQMPAEDAHLGALLAWVDPVPGRDPSLVAQERARIPLSGVLCNTPDQRDDHRIEQLRRYWKKATTPAQRAGIETQITRILSDSVIREWQALRAARAAFAGLGLPPNTELQSLAAESMRRMERGVTAGFYFAAAPHTLAAELGAFEEARGKFEGVRLRGDANVRNLEKELGRVVEGTVVRIDQPRRNFRPCALEIETPQRDIRLRVDKHVSVVGTSIEGVVRELRPGPLGTSTTVVAIELGKGVRGIHALAGRRVELIEYTSYSGFKKRQLLLDARNRASWMLFGQPPARRPVPLPPGDLLELTDAVKRG